MEFNEPRDKIINSLHIKEVVHRLTGVEIGKYNRCACPLHKGEHKNFAIYPLSNSFYCFTCSKGGDLIKFTAEFLGLSYYEAMKKLDAIYNLKAFDKNISREEVLRQISKRQEQERKINAFYQYQSFSYDLLTRYFKWLHKQPSNKAVKHDIAYIERLLDKHLNLTENPIQLEIKPLIRALYSKHRKEVN